MAIDTEKKSMCRTSRFVTECTPFAISTGSIISRRYARHWTTPRSSIEVALGDGLAGMSFNYGFAKETDLDYIEAAATVLEHAKLATLFCRGSARWKICAKPTKRVRGQFAWRRIVPADV